MQSEIGRPSYHTRVERWECDYNDHWNVRFYGRSFQAASEMMATLNGQANPGGATIGTRHLRFHKELRVSAPVEVRSARLPGNGPFGNAVAHILSSNGQLSATALDYPVSYGDHLPEVSADEVPFVLPRGIIAPPPSQRPDTAPLTEVALGPVRGADLDHHGIIGFEALLRFASTIQHAQLNRFGLTPEFAASCGINRMGIEFRVTRGEHPPAGTPLWGKSWIYKIEGKAIWALTEIETADGASVARIEMCVLTVDLNTRKAVPVPDFVYRALG
jgi:acyl-CoA thioester hydrolase